MVILPLVAACPAIVLVHQVALVKELLSEALLHVKQVPEAALQDVGLRLREDGHVFARVDHLLLIVDIKDDDIIWELTHDAMVQPHLARYTNYIGERRI